MSERLDAWLVQVSEAHGLVPPTCSCIGDMVCPTCCPHDSISYGMIPCPDGQVGCCVAHVGHICDACGEINPTVASGKGDET